MINTTIFNGAREADACLYSGLHSGAKTSLESNTKKTTHSSGKVKAKQIHVPSSSLIKIVTTMKNNDAKV